MLNEMQIICNTQMKIISPSRRGRPGRFDRDAMARFLRNNFHCAVVVAMIPMRMMQPAAHEIIHMVAMRNLLMSAARTMDMFRFVPGGGLRASPGIGLADADGVFIHMVAMHVMKVSFVQIIRVAFMFNGGVSAPGTVLVGMILMFIAVAHRCLHWLLNNASIERRIGRNHLNAN